MADFIVNFLRAGNGVRDFTAQHVAETPSQPVQRHFHRAFAHAQFARILLRCGSDVGQKLPSPGTPAWERYLPPSERM